jgi:hypothetical protein
VYDFKCSLFRFVFVVCFANYTFSVGSPKHRKVMAGAVEGDNFVGAQATGNENMMVVFCNNNFVFVVLFLFVLC